ncbi:MAG: tRNA (adenine-N1)-methyltransferase, partial [Acidimicrobiia bacterium]|nr:tRNA (adenine-N1)-methyltransferase [Acidimicrobiia bacterium]
MSGPRPFAGGERALLVDSKARRYLITLADGGEFHTHAGITAHDEIIGQQEGITVRSSAGARYTVVRPTLADFVLKMPRGAQVVYPKDLGPL